MRLHHEIPEDKVRTVLQEFTGVIYQRPPIRASVKRRLRTRTIYYIDFLEAQKKDVLFQVGSEAGTYIRKLCYDVGEVLGVGAHMQELRRTRSGPFTEGTNMVTLHDLAYYQEQWLQSKNDAVLHEFIQPMEKALELLPKIVIRDSAVDAICHGANLAAPGVLAVDSGVQPKNAVAVMSQKGEAVALSLALATAETMLESNRGLMAKTVRVLMPRGVYPKMWRKTSN
jgi:H/ACA ribonucleoprotein complex subunit 4